MKMFVLTALALTGTMLSAQDYKIDFNAKAPWAVIRNHAHRLAFKNVVFSGKKATVITLKPNQKSGADTAWALVSKKFPVTGKKNITYSFSLLSPVKARFGGRSGSFRTAVHFYDKNNKPLKKAFIPCDVPAGTGKFITVKGSAAIPAGAAFATVQTGGDVPNIHKGQTAAVADFVWKVK